MLSNRDMLKSLPFCTESPKQHIFHSKVCHFKIHFPVCPVFQVGENLQLRCNPPQIFSEECVTCLVLPKCQFWTRKIQEFYLNTTENNWRLFFQSQQGKNFAHKLRRPPCLPERTRHLLRRTRSPSDFTFPLGSDLICSHSMRIHWKRQRQRRSQRQRHRQRPNMLSQHAHPLTIRKSATLQRDPQPV